MTEAQNTAVVQDMYAAFSRGDIPRLVSHCADEIVWHAVYGCGPQVPFSGERRGKDAIVEFFRIVAETENFQTFEPREFIATGDAVVTLGHYTATTNVGKQFDGDFAMVFHLRNGKVVRFQEFCDSAGINAAHTAEAPKVRAAGTGA